MIRTKLSVLSALKMRGFSKKAAPNAKTRKGLQRYPFLPQAKKIQAESPVSGPWQAPVASGRKCAQNSYAFILRETND
jgi:hypothetical protein